jgi:DNA-binding SARP family transcriptional activator/tetratricopeptide (TPR) repeat protein
MPPRPDDRLGVRLIGEFAMDGIDLTDLRSRQARVVLKRLALARGDVVGPDALIDAVWPAARPAAPDRDIHVLVSRARAAVGGDRVTRGDGGYALAADWWDLTELEELTREGSRRAGIGDPVGARTAAEAALALVRGALLFDEPDAEWVVEARRACELVVAEARRVAADAALATGQVGDAAAHAHEALRHDAYDEGALRILMRAHTAAGRPASALAEYARFAKVLVEELGADPAAETSRLHEQVLRGETPSTPVAAAATREPGALALIGRQPQLAALDHELAAVGDGTRLVLLIGEPGAGKTALLDAWAAHATSRGAVALRGSAARGDLALQPVLDALAGQSVEPLRLEDPTASGSGGPLPGPGATADALSLRVFQKLDHAVEGLVDRAQGRLALLLDDGDLADPVTWSWLAHLKRRRELSVLVVVAMREASRASATPDRVIEVPPLELTDVATLVGEARAGDLWARSGGNALLLTELARSTDGHDEEIPGSLREAVSLRLSRLGEPAACLRAAAVLGSAIDLDLLAAAMGSTPMDVLDHLDAAVGQGFLTERQGVLQFRHELVRQAVALEVTATRRAWLHRRAAELLASRADPRPLDLARHFRESGNGPLAARSLAEAADLALARLDLAGAERLLDEALALDNAADLRMRRSRVRMSRGDLDGADADAGVAMATDLTGEALELRAWVARNRHDLEGAIRLGRSAASQSVDASVRASSLIAVAFGHRGLGELREADAVLTEAAGAGPELGLPAWTGVLRVHQGRPVEALTTLEPMLGADARRGTHGFWVEHTLQMTAHAYGLLGRVDDALSVVDRLAREIERRGTGVRYAGLEHSYRSWLLRNVADPSALDVALAGLEMAGSQEIRAQCHLDVADCLLRTADLGAAETRLEIAREESEARRFNNKWRFDQRLGLTQARLALAEHDADAALAAVQPVIASATDRGDRRYAVLGRLIRAIAESGRGAPPDVAAVEHDLDRLAHVAVIEGWWIAADLAAVSGLSKAEAVANTLAARVVAEAGAHADLLRAAVAVRLSQ